MSFVPVWTATGFFIARMFHHLFIKGIHHPPEPNIFTAVHYNSYSYRRYHFSTIEKVIFSKENKFFSVEKIFSSVKNKFSILENGTH